jgi:hypothetical protein
VLQNLKSTSASLGWSEADGGLAIEDVQNMSSSLRSFTWFRISSIHGRWSTSFSGDEWPDHPEVPHIREVRNNF